MDERGALYIAVCFFIGPALHRRIIVFFFCFCLFVWKRTNYVTYGFFFINGALTELFFLLYGSDFIIMAFGYGGLDWVVLGSRSMLAKLRKLVYIFFLENPASSGEQRGGEARGGEARGGEARGGVEMYPAPPKAWGNKGKEEMQLYVNCIEISKEAVEH
jgi:hypothetical protein